jgi:putative ribosome biogenesis GTPase RsgA
MHFWDFGGSVIDTPGVREFAMIDVEKEEIQHYFPEIFQTGRECKYHNCLHINEPKCAVIHGLETGEIEETRYITYLKLMEEAEEINQKKNPAKIFAGSFIYIFLFLEFPAKCNKEIVSLIFDFGNCRRTA